jgi:hypothetical protein
VKKQLIQWVNEIWNAPYSKVTAGKIINSFAKSGLIKRPEPAEEEEEEKEVSASSEEERLTVDPSYLKKKAKAKAKMKPVRH